MLAGNLLHLRDAAMILKTRAQAELKAVREVVTAANPYGIGMWKLSLKAKDYREHKNNELEHTIPIRISFQSDSVKMRVSCPWPRS